MNIYSVKAKFNEYENNINICLEGRTELEICKELFGFLTDPETITLNYATYGTLMQATDCDTERFPVLVKATDFLTTKKAHLLDMYFEFYDEYMEDPEEIDASDVHVALTQGYFYHPLSGETIANFSNYIYPVFRPSAELKLYRQAVRQGVE
ncbi:hypothetical protein CGH09_14980 [Vibrio parahaemolyticus]|uniref:hypothetical protein n=1 Tax=Vibrio parahaemolyticus TaxID=670 RepID=UPI00111CDCDF|nr:hypothetical protein [Vibrio parahaemolyticus]TOP78207.1 hypothetical protein CGH09_14980 [Vibrio parahaemolyticus]